MALTRNQIIVLGAVAFIVLFLILGFLGVIPIFKSGQETSQGVPQEAILTFWGIDPSENFKGVLENYLNAYKNVRVNYQQIDEKTYENTLLNAWATGKGPDVFMFHRSWVYRQGDKVAPAPETKFSLYNLRQLFPDVIENDFSHQGKIYALPLYLDSLALFYNKDIFNAKGIALTPTTWNDFKNLIKPLTEFDFSRQIKKSAAAIGGSAKSINNAPDFLSLLMLQFGSYIVNPENLKVEFDQKSFEALNFYLQFATPSNPYYTWTDSFGNSIDSFASGDAAMIFNYAKEIPLIKQKNPFLNFSVTSMPQFNLNQPLNYANYWGLAVSKQSVKQNLAWNFIIFMTTNQTTAEIYVRDSGLPPALRILINKYLTDPNLGTFAKQALSSKSLHQKDYRMFGQSFSNMIESVLSGKQTAPDALDSASNAINSL